jgi:hypothetical protein
VAFQVAVTEKVGQRRLLQQRRVPVGVHLGTRERLGKAGRHDDIPDPEPGKT